MKSASMEGDPSVLTLLCFLGPGDVAFKFGHCVQQRWEVWTLLGCLDILEEA